jgi:hypothetical protein
MIRDIKRKMALNEPTGTLVALTRAVLSMRKVRNNVSAVSSFQR